jgi:hypothetical protein
VCAVLVLCGCGLDPVGEEAPCDELASGDLVVTEVHANPDGTDGDGEYIELFNASGGWLALDGLSLVASRSDGTSPRSHRFSDASIDAGDYFVAGNAPRESRPEHVDYSYGSTLGSLRNSDGAVSIRCGERLIDRVSYGQTGDGEALELDGRLIPDDVLNDDPNHWCAASDGVNEAWAGNWGTPGAANSKCEIAVIEGTCAEGGSGRAIMSPGPGDARITEWMANPTGDDSSMEWVEVLLEKKVDLNELQLGPSPEALRETIDQEACFAVDAGTRVVFGASPAAAPRVDARLPFSLGNSESQSIVIGVGGVVLDRVDYDSTAEGISWQLDPEGASCLTVAGEEYAPGNLGTPAEANPSCPVALEAGWCFQDGVPRPIESPAVGDVRITEWMANPVAAENRDGEWVELRFERDLDLNGLVLSDLTSNESKIERADCWPVPARAIVLFARNVDAAKNGGIERVDAVLSLSLNNSDETISVSIDGRPVDSVTYQRSTPGVATQVDDLGNVCEAATTYGNGDWGTPGSANPRCP